MCDLNVGYCCNSGCVGYTSKHLCYADFPFYSYTYGLIEDCLASYYEEQLSYTCTSGPCDYTKVYVPPPKPSDDKDDDGD